MTIHIDTRYESGLWPETADPEDPSPKHWWPLILAVLWIAGGLVWMKYANPH